MYVRVTVIHDHGHGLEYFDSSIVIEEINIDTISLDWAALLLLYLSYNIISSPDCRSEIELKPLEKRAAGGRI